MRTTDNLIRFTRRLKPPHRWRFTATIAAMASVVLASGVIGPSTYLTAEQPQSLTRLREIQSSVQSVAKNNMNACVAISDGVGIGSGVIVSSDGLVLTAGHVMGTDEKEYEVLLSNGRIAVGKPLGKNLDVDSGMLQLEGDNWPHVDLGSTTSLRTGDWVVSLGHSGGYELGREPPVRTGRLLNQNGYQLITDAVLIGGDSGGPLFDLDGKLIAIHSSIGDSVSENRHVKIEQFKQDWQRLKAGETWGKLPELGSDRPIRKPKIGVKLDLTHEQAKIKFVKPGSPAARTGLADGDIVIGFDGEIITDGRHLIRAVKKHVPADTCFITVLRGNDTLQFEIRLE